MDTYQAPRLEDSKQQKGQFSSPRFNTILIKNPATLFYRCRKDLDFIRNSEFMNSTTFFIKPMNGDKNCQN